MAYSKEELLAMYTDLARGREFILRMHKSVREGDLGTSFHSQHGQEAVDVGILHAMGKNDWIKPTMRSQVAYSRDFGFYRFMCDLFAKRDGIAKGIGFDYHLQDLDKHYILPSGILGTDYPVSTGVAWALKHEGRNEVVITTQGDGTSSEGSTFECWNIAALYQLPIVYVIVNNGWAMSVPLHDESFNPNISEKAAPIGLETTIVWDGNDPVAIRETMEAAIERARQNKPQVVEIKTLRWEQHFYGQREYGRFDAEEVKTSMQDNDPVKRMEDMLLKEGYITPEEIEKIKADARAELEEAVIKARACTMLTKEEIFCDNNVFAKPMEGALIR